MNGRKNQILIGVILILLGVFAFAQNTIKLDYGSLTTIVAGCALLLLYKTKKKSWSLVLGAYLLFFGLAGAVTGALSIKFSWPMAVAGMFLFVPGVSFIVLFHDKNKRGLLVPGCILAWAGLYVAARGLPGFAQLGWGMMFIFLGMAGMTIWFFSRTFGGAKSFWFGLAFIIIGGAQLMGFSHGLGPILRHRGFLPGVIIAAGIFIILKAAAGKRGGGDGK